MAVDLNLALDRLYITRDSARMRALTHEMLAAGIDGRLAARREAAGGRPVRAESFAKWMGDAETADQHRRDAQIARNELSLIDAQIKAILADLQGANA